MKLFVSSPRFAVSPFADLQSSNLTARRGCLAAFCLTMALTLCATEKPAAAQVAEWTWVGGSSMIGSNGGQPGVYGTLGTPAPGNIPGNRDSAATWTDHNGILWLFGGEGLDSTGTFGYLNDLWEFNPSTNEWTWMGGSNTVGANGGQAGVYGTLGVPAQGNIPGSRWSPVTWTDNSGNLWLFGGRGYDSTGVSWGHLNDLWEFNPSTDEWAWIGGSNIEYVAGVYGTLGTPAAGNVPGSRDWAVSWTDHSGNLWLFGGDGFDSERFFGELNDLWEYNPSTGEWAWISGSETDPGNLYPIGSYGTLRTPAPGNVPPARYSASSWTDNNGNLWLFGGFANDGDLSGDELAGELNDLWEFNPSTNEWAWMSGGNTGNQLGVYGTLGVTAPQNVPSFRQSGASWTDGGGNLWFFGGIGPEGIYNDLWVFSPAVNEWTWTGGSNIPIQPGVYGTLGVPAAGNIPGSRYTSATWTDSSGNFWLFGGVGIDTTGNSGDLNDLWKYEPRVTNNSGIPATPGSPTLGTTGSGSGVKCAIEYTIYSQWPGGFEAGITIENTGSAAISNWALSWSFTNGQQITQSWDASEKQNGANVKLNSMGYNGSIPAGGSYTGIGFIGNWNGVTNAIPAPFLLNGTVCTLE